MPRIRFEWDDAKNRSNFVKHGLRFEAAIAVFADPLNLPILIGSKMAKRGGRHME